MDKRKILLELNAMNKNTLMETLNIEYTEIGEDYIVGVMPIDKRVFQPMGILHGGATLALAESVGSLLSHFVIDMELYEIKGIEISGNHLKSKRDGIVKATARFIHKGRTTHLIEIKVVDEDDSLISLCKLTTIVLPKK